jgi:hypothetical protein
MKSVPPASARLETAINFLAQMPGYLYKTSSQIDSLSRSRTAFSVSESGDLSMRILRIAIIAVAALVLGMVRANAQSATASSNAPKLEHFDLNQVDKSLDPCQDFYQYACSKWNAANPIPADQVAWGTGSGLQY